MATIPEIKTELDKLGVEYKSNAKKATLQGQLTRALKKAEVTQEEVEMVQNTEELIEVDLAEVGPGSIIDGPIVDGSKVIQILDDKKHTNTHWHCKCADGTTRHVLKSLL